MKIAVTSVQVPFIRGGAEIMTSQLVNAIQEHGYSVELITMPFRFGPHHEVQHSMDIWAHEDFTKFDAGNIDQVICLKFPTYYLNHPNKIVWLMHQHRSIYELFNTPYGESENSQGIIEFRKKLIDSDTAALKTAKSVYTISNRVSDRLLNFNKIKSSPVYQPPANEDLFYCDQQLDYIFFPSRLESLKRQELLIRAMTYCQSPVAALIAGDGGIRENLQQLICELGVSDRVRLIGRVSDDEMRALYANSLGVFFGPHDEDYGFVTLEAMLSSKPVITCNDSGGPLDFVDDRETGCVVKPEPEEIADAIDFLYGNRIFARQIGRNGFEKYKSLDITWRNIVATLIKNT